MPVQAAEHFLRQARGETALAAYRLWSYQGAGTVTEAAFLATGEDRLHTVRVEAAPLDGLRFLTCDSCEEKVAMSYRLLDHQEAPFVPETHRAGELEYALRPAAMRDYGFIYCLRRDTLTHYLDGMAMPAEERGPFFARFDVGRHRLITLGEASVGAVSVVQREAGLHLANLHLLPAYQSRGLGTAIIHDLQARATAAGLPLTTQALKVNPACAFYQRLGFRIVGDTGIRYRLIWEG
jgi:GNAT superfamily N-acetyltransferase